MIALLASLLISTNATPRELVMNCRALIPDNVAISGRVILRNRKGIVQLERDYHLTRVGGKTELDIDAETLKKTDVTEDDLKLAYLWWDDFSFDAARESETVNGQVCAVVLLKKGSRTVRVWIDRKTGALLQAEELVDGEPTRRLWGTSIKKFGDRWMANRLEVETLGSGHRTKITVEEMK